MKITESKLRKIIRSIILEDADMRHRLSPPVAAPDRVERAFGRTPSKSELHDINDILKIKNHEFRESLISHFGRERFYDCCEFLDVSPDAIIDYDIVL